MIASQPMVPEGWRLAPVEPTEAMLHAAFVEWMSTETHERSMFVPVYSAMLAASPTPPTRAEDAPVASPPLSTRQGEAKPVCRQCGRPSLDEPESAGLRRISVCCGICGRIGLGDDDVPNATTIASEDRREVERLRAALIRVARMIPGVICADGVSSEFLSYIPDELAHYQIAKSASPNAITDDGARGWSSEDVGKLLAMVPSLDREDDWLDARDRWRDERGDAGMGEWSWWWGHPEDEDYRDERKTRDEAIAAARREYPGEPVRVIEARLWNDDFDEGEDVQPFADTRNAEVIPAAPDANVEKEAGK